MLLIIAITYIISFLLSSILFHKKIRISKRQATIFWIFFVISLAIIAFQMQPPSNWDLGRNYQLLDTIRNSHLSFIEFVFGGRATYRADGYRNYIFYNIYRYIIVNIFKDNHWFQTITVIIVYTILGYITIDFQFDNNRNDLSNTLSVVISFSFLPFLYVTSGIRNALAASLVGLGVYLYLYKSKNVTIYLVILFISATIHPAVLITLPFVILSKINIGFKETGIVFLLTFLLQNFARLLSSLGNTYLSFIGISYLRYSGTEQYRGGRGNLYGVLVLSLILFIFIILQIRKEKMISVEDGYDDNGNIRICGFLLFMFTYMLGNFQNYDLVLRPGYIVGMFAPMLSNLMNIDNSNIKNIKTIIKAFADIAVIAFAIYVNYKCFEIFVEAF